MKKIIVDINTPVWPLEVSNSVLSGLIEYACRNHYQNKQIPEELQSFINNNPKEISEQWYKDLFQLAQHMPKDLLQKWINVLPYGWQHAQLETYLESLD